MWMKITFFVCMSIFLGVIWESPTARKQFLNEIQHCRRVINNTVVQYEGWQVIAVTVGMTILVFNIYNFLHDEEKSLWTRIKGTCFHIVRRIPFVSGKINKELEKTRKIIEASMLKPKPGETYHLDLPEKGLSYEELMKELDTMDKLETVDWRRGFTSGCAYNCNDALTKITCDVYKRYCWTNPLHADIFPQIRKMEAEIVHWTGKLFNGGPDVCGCVTSGGTESILMAMKAYRELGYKRGIKFPEIICSTATHAAFNKAAHLFRMKITQIQCDPLTRKINLKSLSRAINRNTIVIVANAPHFPHGIIDPVQEMGTLAVKKNIFLHVDSCLGGFLLPFMERAGFPLDPFDFRVKGVTSISADTHKYGFAPKGSSVLLYANKDIRRHQFFVITDWEGGIYPSAFLSGSRPGGIIASTWAAMMSMGIQGYVDSTHSIIETTRWIVRELNSIPHLYVLGNPLVSVVSVASKEFNIYELNERMSKRGWSLNPLQFPSSVHICVTYIHTRDGMAQRFVKDVKEIVELIMKNPSQSISGAAAVYGTSQAIPDRSIISDIGMYYLDISLTATPVTSTGTEE